MERGEELGKYDDRVTWRALEKVSAEKQNDCAHVGICITT